MPEAQNNLGLVQDCMTLFRAWNALTGEDVPLLWNADAPISECPGMDVRGEPPRVKTLAFTRYSFPSETLFGTIPLDVSKLGRIDNF